MYLNNKMERIAALFKKKWNVKGIGAQMELAYLPCFLLRVYHQVPVKS